MHIANIITNSNINVDKYFNIVNSLDNIIPNLPTLIIGWDIVKTINPDTDFIDKKLSENIYWTFKKTERRDIFESDLYDFISLSYQNLIKDISYQFVDFIQDLNVRKTFKGILKDKQKITYQHQSMLYIYSDKIIYGIDLNQGSYLEYDTEILLHKIKITSKTFLEDKIITEYNDIIEMLDNQIKYIPYLYYIENNLKN
jgi:hypothetical protein